MVELGKKEGRWNFHRFVFLWRVLSSSVRAKVNLEFSYEFQWWTVTLDSSVCKIRIDISSNSVWTVASVSWIFIRLPFVLPAKFWQRCHRDLDYGDRWFFKYSRREPFSLANSCERYQLTVMRVEHGSGKSLNRDFVCSEIVAKILQCLAAAAKRDFVECSLTASLQPLNA